MERRDIGPRLGPIAGEAPLRGLLLYVRTSGGEILRFEGDAEATLGHSADALRDAPLLWARSLHPDDRERVLEWNAGLGAGTEETLEYRLLSAEGGERCVRDTCRLRPGGRGERVGVLLDVGVERTLREQVKALEARIWRSQRLDSLGALATGIAHDFNNLLTTILSSVDLVEHERGLSAEGRADLGLIRQAAGRGSRMVRQILRFARRGESFSPESADLGRTVEDLRAILERTLGADSELRLRVAPAPLEVRCDPAQIEQVVLNLVVNARDAMPGGGVVEIAVERRRLAEPLPTEDRLLPTGDYVLVSVSDTGTGIPDEARARIFEPFFTTKSGDAVSGSGFGLSTVQRIVRGYGGGVTVESVAGKGTTFCVWLPVRDVEEGALPRVAGARPGGTGRHVLVVEDDPEVREVVTRTLIRDGHRVTAVGTAAEALRVFDGARPRFDVVMVDLALPDRPGRELVRALRRRLPELPIVVASAYGPGADEGGRRKSGKGEVFVAKPFTPDQLREAVARALDEADPGEGSGGSYQPSFVQ